MELKDCFTTRGQLKIDPYRRPDNDPQWESIYSVVFDDKGYLKDRNTLINLAYSIKADYASDLVGLFHADIHAGSTKGAYPTIYYFR